jgi:hypothetical protein
VTVQIEAEPPVRPRVGMQARPGPGLGWFPQREADPLTGIRPSRRRPCHKMYCAAAVSRRRVPSQGDGEARPQHAVGTDPRKMPAKQVRSQMTQISADVCRELPAMGSTHGSQVQIHVDARRGTGPGPVAHRSACGR